MVERVVEEGYTVKAACEVVGMSRSSYYRRRRKEKEGGDGRVDRGRKRRRCDVAEDAMVRGKVKEVKEKHPLWGYRRVWAWLRYREGMGINKKRVYRVMKEEGLLVERSRRRAVRRRYEKKLRASRPREVWGIDMTKFWIGEVGWGYLVIVVDWYTKKIVGWKLSSRCRTEEWKEALHRGLNEEFEDGVRGKGLKLVSDNGSQPTSVSFMKEMKELGIEQVLTSYNNPRGNAETERMFLTMKEDLLWVEEFERFEDARREIEVWVREYNERYVHSSLGYRSPEEFEREYYGGSQSREVA